MSLESKTTSPHMSEPLREQIAKVLSAYLADCNVHSPYNFQLDKAYHDDCFADAKSRGIDIQVVKKHLEIGIAFGDTAYRHIKNYSTRIFIGVWTALLVHIDDFFEEYADGIKEFASRFSRQEPHTVPVLNQMADMSRELNDHWDTISANMILAAMLDYLTATMIENNIEGMEVRSKMAPGFPQFMRTLSGISKGYCVQVFPRDLDMKEWIQAMPDLWHFADFTNDILSFYKEELNGESVNFVSISANAKGVTKVEALKQLADHTAGCYQRCSKLLQSSPEALSAFRDFCVGEIVFHFLSPRYKLHELQL
ncbi:hypothetical protein NP233_g9290 [Leucocoprinus birnbaumii]|uniref:Trichodiene synthase n=1 Tax=Leucocoprinus birnbaumii TaxID=56174 RepID=A0AAD5VME5_9AGAR|nr:hypothetical protein NP233_g9290 [Leucocoprinus birnbaumii]